MKKQLLLAALLLFTTGAFAQGGAWTSQATGFTPVSSGVRYVSAVDTNVLWICSYDGSGGGANRQDFSHTSNGGANWTAGTTPAPTNYDWSMIAGVNADSAFAMFFDATAGAGGAIYRTADGGASWTQVGTGSIFDANSFPDVVHFWNASEGFALGDPNGGYFEIYTTSDGGDTWTRVPQANIPAPLSGEYGIVGHYQVMGDNVWFDTNKGRVYRSSDRGQTWRVGTTGITVPTTIGAIDIAFYSPSRGIARLYNAGVNTVKTTSDSGATWTTLTITGNFWGSDVKYVPGTLSRLISTGAATGFIGSSYSDDGGLTWVDIETSAQRTALGVVDSMHMWCGGFTTSTTDGGIFRYTSIPSITCSDPNINPGTAVGSTSIICPAETLTVTATGVYAPTVGNYAGVAWIISSTDITGNANPQLDPGYIGGSGVAFPAPSSSTTVLINDGTLIDGVNLPYGTYYFTPVVFGNATGTSASIINLTLDPACTYTGNSVAVYVAGAGDSACATGIQHIDATSLKVTAFQVESGIKLRINSKLAGNAVVEVMDITGRSVYASASNPVLNGVNVISIDALLSSGTYVVKTTVGGAIATTKFVKQ